MSADAAMPRRILLIDDNDEIHADYRKILQPPDSPARDELALERAALFGETADAPRCSLPVFSVESAMQGQAAVELARRACGADRPHMVAFVDMRMPPGWNGITTIQHLWQVDPRMQIVICTAYSDESLDSIATSLGICDRFVILKKPFETAEVQQLALTLSEKWLAERAAEQRVEQLEGLVQKRTAEIEHASLHDRLTGLPNRAYLLAQIEACLQRLSRDSQRHFAVLFADFDRFKLINDSLGHAVGDELLVQVAQRLRDSLRAGDVINGPSTASRLGGDEFVILLEELRECDDAGRVAERLVALLSEPYPVGERALHLSASIGVAVSRHGYASAADMLRDADTAMYRAKAAGRARFCMFDGAMHEQVLERMTLEQGLRAAVRDGSIDVHYQPIVSLTRGVVTGFEALLRWSPSGRPPVPTERVIAVAEESGLIQPLGMLVLQKACAELRRWQSLETCPLDLRLNVNLSQRQLADPKLAARLHEVIQSGQVNPDSIVLEITESSALADLAQTSRMLQSLRDIGVWLQLDDFGTGYSSLSVLYGMPLDGIKIDRAFIQSVVHCPQHRVVLESIVHIARTFELEIVAEGVETTEQYELLCELGIDLAQGYLFGKPVSSDHSLQLLGKPASLLEACMAAFPRPLR